MLNNTIAIEDELERSFLASELTLYPNPIRTFCLKPESVKEPITFQRIFDIVFSAFALIITSPVFILISLLILIISPSGPVLFRHARISKNGKNFYCYKFRTMIPNAENVLEILLSQDENMRREFFQYFKLKNDPRVIPYIGAFLRKTSLDELPQFINVLMGDMSVVGPRPIITGEKLKYGRHLSRVLSVKPGITGLWQTSGRNNISYHHRVLMDVCYVKKQSFWLDLQLILKTIFIMLTRKGAY